MSVRRATAVEMRACRMLLPGLTGMPEGGGLVVAVAGDPQRIVGAAALTGAADADGRVPVDIEVIEPLRGHDVERDLLAALVVPARGVGARGLKSHHWLDETGEAARAMGRLGFSPVQRRYEYTASGPDILAGLGPICRGVEEREKVRSGARCLRAQEVDPEQIVELYVRCFGGPPDAIRRQLDPAATADPIDLKLSPVVVLDDGTPKGRVVAFLLGRSLWESKVFECDWRAVDPEFRRGWVNVWMMYRPVAESYGNGLTHVRYRAYEDNADTRRMFKHINGSSVGTSVIVARPLDVTP